MFVKPYRQIIAPLRFTGLGVRHEALTVRLPRGRINNYYLWRDLHVCSMAFALRLPHCGSHTWQGLPPDDVVSLRHRPSAVTALAGLSDTWSFLVSALLAPARRSDLSAPHSLPLWRATRRMVSMSMSDVCAMVAGIEPALWPSFTAGR